MWREATLADFQAALSDQEARAFARTDGFDDTVIADTIANTTAHVRGAIRSGRKCRMPNDAKLIPDMFIIPAMDFAAFNLLKRFNRTVNESRSRAYDRAASLFEKTAAGQIVPEDYGEEPQSVDVASSLAKPSILRKHRLLGRHQENGI